MDETKIVNRAEQVMKDLSKEQRTMVTTSQIRKFLTAVNTVTEKINVWKLSDGKDTKKLPPELQAQVQYLKVKLAYQIGRSASKRGNPVETFANKAGLMACIDDIGDSTAEYEKFAHYIEALVAYHKYYGGRD